MAFALRQTAASRHRRFLYSATVSVAEEEHILLGPKSVLPGWHFMTLCVAHMGVYINTSISSNR